jgi:CRISPR type III-A-associated protein Csm2
MTNYQGRGGPPRAGNRPGQGRPGSQPDPISPDDAKRIIDDGDVELLISRARSIADDMRGGGESYAAQVRRLFGEVKRIEMSWTAADPGAARRLKLLKPRLAYQVSRQRKLEPLQRSLDPLIDRVGSDRVRFQHFVEFFEAVVAYAKQ